MFLACRETRVVVSITCKKIIISVPINIGGPIIYYDPLQKYGETLTHVHVVAGVVSAGHGCAKKGNKTKTTLNCSTLKFL
jgi:hypothetical protein